MNENQITVVEKICKKDAINDNCIRDCHNKFFDTIEYRCEYDIKLTIIANIEIVIITIADKSMNLYELNEKLKIARENGFIFNQLHKLTRKKYSNLSNIIIHYYLKLQKPMCHR